MRIIYGSMMMITILVMETEFRFTIIIDHLNLNLIVNNNLDSHLSKWYMVLEKYVICHALIHSVLVLIIY